MKKFLSLALVLVMVMSLSIPAFADKPAWAANQKENDEGEEIESELPKGLQKKDVIPYGHRKDQEVTVEEMEDLIDEVLEYIENLDLDLDNDDYDLEGIISLEAAKKAALEEVDGTIVKIELEVEDRDDEDENQEASYKVEVRTDKKTYEIEINAFDGTIIEIESDENDDDEEEHDRDRDQDRDEYREDMVSAIMNLIDRIEYELEKDEPELNHFMFKLESKFNVLQKKYGENPEKEDYTNDLEELLGDLKDIQDDSFFDTDEQEAIQIIIDAIDVALDTEDVISEADYDGFKKDADEYLDRIDQVVETEEVKALLEEVKDFIFENDFGSELGDYSPNEAMALLTLVIKYPSLNNDDLEEYFKDLKLSYKKFKMSKLVAGDYLETLLDYRDDLVLLNDEDLTDSEETLRDSLIEMIDKIEENEKMTLGNFYDVEEDALTLLEDPTNYEEALGELINDVRAAILKDYENLNEADLEEARMTLLSESFVALVTKNEAETEEEFEEAYRSLEEAFDVFNELTK